MPIFMLLGLTQPSAAQWPGSFGTQGFGQQGLGFGQQGFGQQFSSGRSGGLSSFGGYSSLGQGLSATQIFGSYPSSYQAYQPSTSFLTGSLDSYQPQEQSIYATTQNTPTVPLPVEVYQPGEVSIYATTQNTPAVPPPAPYAATTNQASIYGQTTNTYTPIYDVPMGNPTADQKPVKIGVAASEEMGALTGKPIIGYDFHGVIQDCKNPFGQACNPQRQLIAQLQSEAATNDIVIVTAATRQENPLIVNFLRQHGALPYIKRIYNSKSKWETLADLSAVKFYDDSVKNLELIDSKLTGIELMKVDEKTQQVTKFSASAGAGGFGMPPQQGMFPNPFGQQSFSQNPYGMQQGFGGQQGFGQPSFGGQGFGGQGFGGFSGSQGGYWG